MPTAAAPIRGYGTSEDPQIVDFTITIRAADWLAEHCRNLTEQRLAASANIIPAKKASTAGKAKSRSDHRRTPSSTRGRNT